MKVVAPLKDNLPKLWAAAPKRFARWPPKTGSVRDQIGSHAQDSIELRGAGDCNAP